MIITRKKSIPFYWIVLAVMPWGASSFTWNAMNSAFLFSLRHFIANPAELTFILTLPAYVSIFVGPTCNFLSDRIWTRIGRRKPFVLVAWVGIIVCLVLLPLMPNLIALVAVYIFYSLFMDVGQPIEALKQEIVPPHQRGRSTAAMQWMQNIGSLTFSFVALGRFDDYRYMGSFLVSGETLIYWCAALLMIVTFFVLALGIKEIRPPCHHNRERVSILSFFTAILDRELWPVYTLIFGASMLAASLGPLSNLLYTDQWGYSKQDMGTNVAVGGVINIFIIGFLGIAVDRFDRMKTYQILIVLSLLLQAFYFVYVEFILSDHRPSLVEIILFGETGCILGLLTGMVYIPLVYDYVTRDKMGTYAAGAGLLGRLTGIITLNAMGLFIWGYAVLFQPPAGEMIRLCLNRPMAVTQVRQLLSQYAWSSPVDGTVKKISDVTVRPWCANGAISAIGTSWEVRINDKDSETLEAQKEEIQGKLSLALADENTLRDNETILSKAGDVAGAQKAQTGKLQMAALSKDLTDREMFLQTKLDARADSFAKQVTSCLSSSLLQNDSQLVSASLQGALLIEVPVVHRIGATLEKMLVLMRRKRIGIIDMRPVERDATHYGVAISVVKDPKMAPEQQARQVLNSFQTVYAIYESGGTIKEAPPLRIENHTALSLHLRIVEHPLDDRPSPVTRVVNSCLGLFNLAPQPEQRIDAVARSLRLDGSTEHVGIEAEPGQEEGISIMVLLLPQTRLSSIDDTTTNRLRSLLGNDTSPEIVQQARTLYDRVVAAASVQNITVEKTVLSTGYAPMQYDYMSGYIGVILLGLVGFAITLAFSRMETMGLVRKLGREEAEASSI